MKINSLKFLPQIAIFLAFSAAFCRADDGKEDSGMAALRKRFEQRYEQVHALKSKGVIGETSDGYVEFVKEKDKSAASLVDDENADRKKLYELIAKKEGTTVAKVAERNAKRNFEKAK